ncbi:MAG: dsbD, partial [Bacteriovoracaceae bacterium]|nr:dsbD [Bacteriovoracaceae bacterium]
LLLLISPQLLSVFPKPGMWMNRMKNFLGYTLIIAVLWLLYVLHQQTGNLSIFLVLLSLLGIYISLRELKTSLRWLLVFFLAGLCFLVSVKSPEEKSEITSFSQSKVEDRVQAGENLFVVVTADWCLTCKYNEKLVTDTDWFKKLLKEKHYHLVIFDWTQRNEAIGQFLKKYGRVGIPFSMLINKNKTVVLPELLTQSIVEEAFKN